MISSNDVCFSSIIIDDDLPSPAPIRTNSVASPDFLDDFLLEFNMLDGDHMDLPLLDSNELDALLDGHIGGLDQAQTEIVDGQLPNLLEQLTLSSEDYTANNQSKTTNTTRTDSVVVKTSDLHAHSNFINSTSLCETGESLKLRTPPYLHQRARREKDLMKDLHYIATPSDNWIDFEMLELRSRIPMNTSVVMRVSRTTIPYGPDGIVLCHPYPLWVKDAHAKVHHGSLLVDITDQIMNNQPLKFKKFIMERLGQKPLKKITQWPIYTSNQLDCNGFYSFNTNEPKTIIENCNLRYSVLHFQIFFVDENQIAYPTDLLCETQRIFEYEANERQNIQSSSVSKRKHQKKRLQQKPITARRKNATKNRR